MEATKKKVVIDNQEYDLPEGIEPLGEDGLFMVDWNLIEIAKEISNDEKEFRFFNPRHLGQYEVEKDGDNVEVFLGQGFSKDEMRELMNDIVHKGQEYPLQAFFIFNEQVKARVHDGERRYRCLERAKDKNIQVWSRRDNKYLPANEIYGKVLCKIECMTEEEAFVRACVISETSVKWGDGALARTVKMLYSQGKTDDEICKALNKSKPWLADTCTLNDLDDYCFSFLLANRINRRVALDLVKVKDVSVRQSWLREAWKDALENHAKLQAKNEKLLQKAEVNQELAESETEEAKVKGESDEVVAGFEAAATEAGEKTKKRQQIKAASAKPMVKSKNLRKASGFLNALRAPKIKKKLQVVETMIENNDTSLVDMKILRALKIAYQCILDGEEDMNNVLKKLAG